MNVKEIIEKSSELLGVELTEENTENFYGICEEYCLMQGDYETASAFNEKYKKAILERYAEKKERQWTRRLK